MCGCTILMGTQAASRTQAVLLQITKQEWPCAQGQGNISAEKSPAKALIRFDRSHD